MKGFFQFLTVFDWISPAAGLAHDLATDPLQARHHTFFMDCDSLTRQGFNPHDVRDLLQQNGYRPSMPQLTNTPGGLKCHITIPLEWEEGARELLHLNGVPLESLL